MSEVKFRITDKVVYLNTVTRKLEELEVKGIRVVATGISKDEDGNNILDGDMVLYETVNGPTLAESEVFADKESAKKAWKEIVERL